MEAPNENVTPIGYRSPLARAVWVIIAVAGATAIATVNGVILTVLILVPGSRFTLFLKTVGPAVEALIPLAPLIEMTLVPAALAAWALRCRRNLDVLPEPRLRWSAAWAACGWFVPVAGLLVPLLCLREMWAASTGRRPPLLLVPGWVAWILGGVPFAWVILATADRWDTTIEMTLAALSVAAALLSGVGAILVVVRLTLLQERRLRPLQEGTTPAPAWGRPPRPARAAAIVASAAIGLATLGGAVMLAAGTVSLALGSFELIFGPGELILAWGVGLATYVLFGQLVGMVATALWARRTYRNLPALGASSLGWSPGWAAASWFIPTANLAVPYLVVRDTWPRPGRALLRAWWAAWLTSLALGIASNVLHTTISDPTQLAGDITGLAGDLALLLAGAAAVVIIQTVTRHQVRMARSGGFPQVPEA